MPNITRFMLCLCPSNFHRQAVDAQALRRDQQVFAPIDLGGLDAATLLGVQRNLGRAVPGLQFKLAGADEIGRVKGRGRRWPRPQA